MGTDRSCLGGTLLKRRRRRKKPWANFLKKSGTWICLLTFLLLIFALKSNTVMRLLYPFPYREQVLYTAAQNQVDPHLVMAVIYNESRFVETAVSRTGALGLMQIMPETGAWIAGKIGYPEVFRNDMLFEPDVNLTLGIWYMSYLSQVFDGNITSAVAAYNAGEGVVRQWLKQGVWSGSQTDLNQIPYRETRQYVENVIKHYELYQSLYQKAVLTAEVHPKLQDFFMIHHRL